MSTRLRLWIQRQRWPVPVRLRRRLGQMLRGRGSGRGSSPVDDWSAPLIGTGPLGPSPAPAPRPAAVVPPAADGVPVTPTLRCVIATGVLDPGGLAEVVTFLARRLPAHGVATSVLHTTAANGDATPLHRALVSEGIGVAQVPEGEIDGWLAAHRPDVISAHDPPEWFVAAVGRAAIPLVETLHGLPTPLGTDWKRESARSEHITAFVAVSDLVRHQYLAGNPAFPADSVLTIPNAFNDSHRAAVDRAEARAWLGLSDEFLFLSLGRHCLQKNTYGLVAAFADAAAALPDVHLLIAGRVEDWLYAKQVRLLRDAAPARDRMHLRDNSENVAALLAAADAFVLDSFFEGWPLSSMEALAAGLPVVMSDVSGAREQLGADGTRGIVVPNPIGDPEQASWRAAGAARFEVQHNREELVDALRKIAADRDHWAAQRASLAAESRQRFSAHEMAMRHAAVLERARNIS